ncbi:MAG TPA: hypothetical protein PKJ26_01035 [Candidatus Woesebacteria bacterium]|nr:hypothetical protein [Candidatus Woesebacteria bacterium]HNS65059.1 hypothetical protein [Candidatus Woesebacteria bacterium]
MIEDEATQEIAAVMRLITAAERNEDRFTGDIAFAKAVRLLMTGRDQIPDSTFKIIGLDRVQDIPNNE